jgi:transcriptional regulator with XRE-family HTH domain
MAEESTLDAQQRREHFRVYLRERLAATGVSMRQASLQAGKGESYFGQLLSPEQSRQRALPSPDELRAIAPLLGVSLVELLEMAYGIPRAELEAELGTLAAHTGALAAESGGLTADQLEEVRAFVAFVKARGVYRRQVREHGSAELGREP